MLGQRARRTRKHPPMKEKMPTVTPVIIPATKPGSRRLSWGASTKYRCKRCPKASVVSSTATPLRRLRISMSLPSKPGSRPSPRSSLQLHPSARECGTLDCVQHALDRDGVIEIWIARFFPRQRDEEISQRGNESMLVADGVSGLPEILCIQMVRTAHRDVPHALLGR